MDIRFFFVARYPKYKVVSIQQCPGQVARVCFSVDSAGAKDVFECLGAVPINGVQCEVLRSPPPAPMSSQVMLWPRNLVCMVMLEMLVSNVGPTCRMLAPVLVWSVWLSKSKSLVLLPLVGFVVKFCIVVNL